MSRRAAVIVRGRGWRSRDRRLAALCLLLLGLDLLVLWDQPLLDGVLLRQLQARPPQPTIVFVIYDTVRADHTSLCGYGRPTTPTLERLVAEGAQASCEARTPGSWTVPSHASYFTGVSVPEHRADNALVHAAARPLGPVQAVGRTDEAAEAQWLTQSLGPELPTLAERLAARGYQTALVSENPLLNAAVGLDRGFELTRIGSPNQGLVPTLTQLDPERPLFLFLNFYEAHDPRPPPPPLLSWLPAGLAFTLQPLVPEGPWARYVNGQMSADEAEDFRARLVDAYDHGVYRDDEGLRRALWALERAGWLSGGLRLAVTSDHGELLGEHGLLEHGCYVWEELTRVPLLIYDSAGTPTLSEGPISATEVHDFLLEGALASARRPVRAHGLPVWWRTVFDDRVGATRHAALWEGARKLVWTEGSLSAYALDVDPGEQSPLPVEDEGERARALAEGRTLDVFLQGGALSQDVIEALKAAGYLE